VLFDKIAADNLYFKIILNDLHCADTNHNGIDMTPFCAQCTQLSGA